MSLVPNSFKFSRGQLLKQLTVDRMNAILSMARRGQPAMGGHKGLLIKHTPNGWTASVLNVKRPGDLGLPPFKVSRAEGLNISIEPGHVNATLIAPNNITLPAGQTSKIYIKLALTPGPSDANIKFRYDIDTATIEDETDVQTDTGDSYADESGIAWFLIAEVSTDTTNVTAIDQKWTGNLAWAWSSSGNIWGPRS